MMRPAALLAMLYAIPLRAAETAATAAPSPLSAGSLMQVLLALVLVLALMAGGLWLIKRLGMAGGTASNVARVIGGVSVGNRERVVVVEVADQWIVVGVAPGRVQALSTMSRQPAQSAPPSPPSSSSPPDPGNFAAWLKQTIDKRNGK